MSLILKDVTLCAADCVHPALAARALAVSMDECQFGDAVLFTDVPVFGNFRTVRIAPLRSRSDYSVFVLKHLVAHLSTPFVLIVQWDGYVLDSRCWRPEFKNFDYVGAHWPWHKDGMSVGNGGFSLRSRRLLEITAHADFQLGNDQNEDELICRAHRRYLEQQFGIQIAPIAAANLFAYERGVPETRTFGFHGLFNMWRHLSDAAIAEVVAQLGPGVVNSREYIELLFQYVTLRKFDAAMSLFTRLKASLSSSQVLALADDSLGDPALAARFIGHCERLATFE